MPSAERVSKLVKSSVREGMFWLLGNALANGRDLVDDVTTGIVGRSLVGRLESGQRYNHKYSTLINHFQKQRKNYKKQKKNNMEERKNCNVTYIGQQGIGHII